MTRTLTGLVALAFATILSVSDGMAQTQTRVSAQKDWSVFRAGEGEQKVCWIASKPTQSTALRGGQTVQVRRGDIFLMVAFRPADGAANEVSFLAGYPFKKGSTVEASVGSDKFEMFTVGENAWLSSGDKDKAIVDAFKRGANAKFVGTSSRGTKTVDTFSLQGFTAAVDEATKLCS